MHLAFLVSQVLFWGGGGSAVKLTFAEWSVYVVEMVCVGRRFGNGKKSCNLSCGGNIV